MGSWQAVQRTYLVLTVLATLAASLIWGINTLLLLDAGLTNTQAFAANAFFTAGMVLFEIPTGVVADSRGRRTSYLWGAGTLLVSTLLYWIMWQIAAPFWAWAAASALIGFGFTFFSGAMEAWLVDALTATDYPGELESVFGRGQTMTGVAMLTGSLAGGFIAQFTNLGVPYLIRAGLLAVTFASAAVLMRDLGFTPKQSQGALVEARALLRDSLRYGLGNPPMRWLMLAAPFLSGVGIFAFYAMQPFLLELYGDQSAFGVAGLAAAIVAGSQIVGGLSVPLIRRIFTRRTHVLIGSAALTVIVFVALGATRNFWLALGLLVVWSLAFSAATPMRQAYVNGLIPSEQRATVLSFDSLMGSAGGVAFQPVLGRAADVWSYGTSYIVSGAIALISVPLTMLARREDADCDRIDSPPRRGAR